jgi:factor associated with neutral sphingomyelinase activation
LEAFLDRVIDTLQGFSSGKGYELKFSTDSYTAISILSNTPAEHKAFYSKKPLEVRILLEKNDGVKAWIQTLMNLNKSISISGMDHIFEVSKMLMMHCKIKTFDRSRMESINEVPLFKEEIFVTEVQPLTVNYGFILATNINLYIQPVTTKEEKITRLNLKHVSKLYKRRYHLKDIALEVFLKGGESHLLAFDTTEVRDTVFEIIRHRSNSCVTNQNVDMTEYTEKWKRREISNYEYLMKLNEFALRSFNDLSQYPVFPWIIKDYESSELDLTNPDVFRDLSKPIGALNDARLNGFLERREQQTGQKYLYGTHYSSPFYVVGYLVRQFPLYMLHLNNGKFDRSDRIFNSIKEDWNVNLSNPAL